MLIFQRQQETNRLADSGNYNLNILELNKHQELQKNQKHINNKMKGMCRISETNILNYEEEEKCTHSMQHVQCFPALFKSWIMFTFPTKLFQRDSMGPSNLTYCKRQFDLGLKDPPPKPNRKKLLMIMKTYLKFISLSQIILCPFLYNPLLADKLMFLDISSVPTTICHKTKTH